MPTTAPESDLAPAVTHPPRRWWLLGLVAAVLALGPACLAHEKIQALRYSVCRCGGSTA